MSGKSFMNGGGESYSGVVPAKQPNKGAKSPAEAVEERPLAKENTARAKLVPDTEPGERAKRAGACARSCKETCASTPNIPTSKARTVCVSSARTGFIRYSMSVYPDAIQA